MSNENNEGLSKENSVGASAVNENTVNQAAENHQALYEHLDKKFGPPSERIRRGMADFEEAYRPHTGSDYHYEQESFTDKEYDQGAVYDLASGFWNSFVVGSIEGAVNLPFTIANAIHETQFANDWIEGASKIAENFEYIYSDDAYKPIEKFGDINSSHFWSGLGNGIGFVAAIARGAGIATGFTKGARAFKRGKEAIEGTSEWFKAGANARNTINTFLKNTFKRSKTAKVIKKTPKFKEGIKNAKVRESMIGKLVKIQKLSEKSMKNSARIGSFITGTTLMYGMVQEEAKAAGLDATDSARLALGVASVVSLTEGMALEWIGRIPAASAQKALIKKATKAIAKNSARRTPGEIMNLFTPHYAKAIRSLDVVKGASIEFGQEFVQTYIEQGAKQMYDALWADEDATVGKGKFGMEIFDFEADSVSGFFGNKKDSYKAFTNSMFAGFLGAIIGGGMAGFQLATHPGVRNLGNESMFNLVVDDVLNEKIGRKAENRKKIVETLDKALKDGSINQKQHQDTIALMDEMQEYAERNNKIKHIEDPVAQYQLYTLDKTYKEIAKNILDLDQVEEDNKTEPDVVQEEKLKLAKQKNDLLETLLESIGVNMNEIFRKETAETLDPNEFNDKMLAYQAIAEKIANNEITTKEDLKDFIKEVYDTDYKKKYEETKAKVGKALDEAERKGLLLKPVEKEEYDKFKKDKNDISEQRKNYLANKLKDKKKLNKFEKEMYEAHKDEINKLKDEFIAEEKAKKEEEEGEKSEPEAEFNLKEYKDKLSKLSDKELEEEFNEITNNPSDPNLTEKMDSYMQEDAKRKKPPSTPPKSKPPVSKPPASGTETKAEKEEREDNEKFAENEQKIKDKEDELKKDRENKKTGGKSYTKKQRKDIQDEIDKLKKENEEIEKKREKRAEAKAKAEEEIKKAEEERKRQEAEAKKKAEAEAEAKRKAAEEAARKAEEERKKKEREAKEKEKRNKKGKKTYYEVPVDEGYFDTNQESTEATEDQLYEIEIAEGETEGTITINPGANLSLVLNNPDLYLRGAVKSLVKFERGVKSIKVVQKGIVRKEGDRLVIVEPMLVIFEDPSKTYDEEALLKKHQKKQSPPTKPKTEGDVEVDDDGDTSDTGVDSEINPQTAEGKQIENNAKNTAQKNEEQIEDDSDEEINLEQRKGIESKSNESQKISDNPELFEKIREHFQKMFPMIPVHTVNRLINKHGLEILGRVAKDGITISEEAFQSTLVHEYAHVYIDLIADKEIVKNALEWIKTTEFFNRAKKAYPSYTTEKQAMEALVQAMSENAVPKLEEKLSDSQISRWMSIAKKLWRSIKRFFTKVNSKNYLDYLSDELVFRSQPIMVETNYLDENGQEQRKAIFPDVVKFNNNFLLAQTKKFVINSLRAGDNLTAERVVANLHKMLINRMESDKDLHTVALQAKFEELTEENFENFNDLTPAEKIDTLLKQTIYEEDITYNDHVLKVTEQLVKLPTEDVKQDSIEEIINKIEKEEENTGKVEKERIKGTKTISGSVNSILGTLVDSNGDKIHEDLVFSYLAKVSESSVTNQEATRKITNDAKKGNKVAIALMSVLGAAKNYDKAISGAEVFQTLLNQMLSLQSVVYHATNVQVKENGKKEIRIKQTSESRLKANRTAEFKRRMLSVEFLSSIILKDMSIVDAIIKNNFGFFNHASNTAQFDFEQVSAIGDLLFGLDEGEFSPVDYVDWLIDNDGHNKKDKSGKFTTRANALKKIKNIASYEKKKQLAANFFMFEILNTAIEQIKQSPRKEGDKKFREKFNQIKNSKNKVYGVVYAFRDFAAEVYDGNIHNANMFINSSGNALSTIRLGSYLNRSFTAIAKHTEQAEKKNNKTVPSTSLDGRPMNYYLYKNNPVFKRIYESQKSELTIDDAINFINQKVTEHTGQNEIDVLIAQLTYFSNVQSADTYWQKLMINDRSHSNFLKVKRLTPQKITDVLRDQRGVDEYLLNENYNKIKSKAQQKKYLDEFNKISLNFAYEIDGVVKVLPFNHEYLVKPMSEFGLSEEVQKGFQSKLNGITKEKNLILETLEKTKLKEAISADHVGPNKRYGDLKKLVLAYIMNDRVNRLAINDIISEPIPYRLLKPKYNSKTNELEYNVDPANIIKRNSGFDSLGVRVDLSHQKTGKTVKTYVFELNDENGEAISDSFLFRGNQMTQAIQKQLGDKELDEIGDNSKDGEYMVTEDGRNVYHKNSSINSKENIETDKDGNEVRRSNNLIDIAKAMMGENYKESRYYKMAKILEMLEEQYGESHHIQIIDVEATKGSRLYSDKKAMSIDDIYDNVSKGNFDAIEGTSYTYDSENFYIPFNEAKKLSKKSIQNQKSRFATQLVKILTNHSWNQQIAIENSNQLEELMVELLHKQLGVKQDTEDYKNSTTGRVLFQTKAVLNALKDSVDQLQDPDTIQLIDEILKYNEEEGVRLDKAKETIKKYEEKHGKFEDYVKGVVGYNGNTKKAWAKAVRTIEEKGTVNKIDHPSMLKQLKQVILAKVSSRGLDIRVPGAYLKMVPDIDGRLKDDEVLLPWSMFGDSMEAAQAFLDEQNKKGGLYVPGVRVPASDAISTLNARVVGLIGDSNMAVLPHGFTLKSDADHDGDKVFIYKPNVKTENNKTVIQENTVENKIYNLINDLMQSEDYKKRIEDGTINLDKFEDIVNAIDEELKADGKKGLRKDFNFGTSSEMSETDARLSFGEVAVGILAVAGKLNSALYQSNTYFKGTPNVTVMGQKLDLDKINAPKTSNDIAMLLQAALDIAKKPVLLTSGINASNINVVVAMLISGVELKSIIKFVNQDQVKDFYKRDNTKNNSFNERENKDRLKKDIEQQLKEAEKNNESDLVKENLKALMFFTELSNELKTVTSVVQLDGKLPNEGYELKEVKQAIKLMKNPKSKTKLSYTELAEKPINQHYEKIVDFALDLMTHHFITENVSYYDEIKQIQSSREYIGVQEFDMATEKRRLDDMFALMIAQKLEIDDEVSSVKYGDTTELMSRIAESVRLASRYMYLRVKNSDNIIEKRFKEFELDLLDEVESKNEESYKLDLAFRSLKTKIGDTNSTFGELINEALDEATWDAQGKTVNGITKEAYVKQFIASLEDDGVKIPVTKQNIPNLVNVAIRYKEFIEENMSEMEESRLKGKNRFLKLLQLKIEDGDYIVTGKNDIRYLTSTEKRQAQEDFLKLPLELQQDFKAYQMLKFGLSNKLGSLISIMPNDFTVEFMKYISQIEADGQKESKIYNLEELQIANNYNDLYYPLKKYKKANKLIDNKGNIIKDMSQINNDANVTLQTELTVNGQKTYNLIKGKPGVRFKIDGDENLYEWKRANKEDNVVRLIENPARKTNAYTVFRGESLMDVSDDAEKQGEECGI